MKKLLIIMMVAASFAACKQTPKTSGDAGSAAKASDSAVTYTVDTAASTLLWKGWKKVTGSHNGSIEITDGSLSYENGDLKAGTFTINMKTITVLDGEKDKAKLVGHLSSVDFFNVDSFPTAKFEITKVEKVADPLGNTHKISGNLTLKGVTREITFPAKLATTEAGVTATAKTEINRLEWGVMWGNKNDTKAGAFLKENYLDDMIALEINLTAKK